MERDSKIVHVTHMAARRTPIPKPRQWRRTFLRQWREHRDKTLEQAGEFVGITHASLSRIERGLQPYSQEILEGLAELYATDVASLLMRDPTDPEGMWSVWDQAKPGERNQIADYARFLTRKTAG